VTISEGSEGNSASESEESSEETRNFSVAKAALENMNARKVLLSEDKKGSPNSKKFSISAMNSNLPYKSILTLAQRLSTKLSLQAPTAFFRSKLVRK
jgi:hypothetical protein